MKKLFFLLFWSSIATAQNLYVDVTFDNDGFKTIPSLSSAIPFDVLFQNGQYLVPCRSGQIVALDEGGSLDAGFGNQGIATISVPDGVFFMSNYYRTPSHLYIVGYKNPSDNNDITRDVIVARLTNAGVLDTTFGVGGVARIDLGGNDAANALVVQNDGIFVLGTRRLTTDTKIFLLKLTGTGAVDTAYATGGFKTFNLGTNLGFGNKILPYNGGYLLVGSSTPGSENPNLALIHIDTAGNLVTTFGIGGIRSVQLVSGTASITIDGAQIGPDGKLYFAARAASSFGSGGETLTRLNIATGAIEQVVATYYQYPFFKVLADGSILTTGANYCFNSPCDRGFELRKLLPSLESDPAFADSGNYRFIGFLPYGPGNDYQSTAFYIHEDGRIAIAGKLFSPYSQTGNGFGMLRVGTSALNVNDNSIEKIHIIPSPASSYFEIKTPDNAVLEEVALYNMQGRCVKIYRSSSRYNVDDLSEGVYIVRAAGTFGTWNGRLLKSK
ncbi:MAG: T9SS type A sorting domain-containing protein [Proteobacteria bacterium]|nr:MAG: T9SS type A sorting domain-containing protein [Pseudomonadota bacterium]